jgi:CelD/BcsL family acetyltransferase involved in cellulose biosynthesis
MPFCPHCRTEYRQGFVRCSDCGDALVAELPELKLEAEELAAFLTTAEAEMVKEMLEDNSIPAFVHGQADPISIPSRAEQIALFVDEREVGRAMEIYEAFFGQAEEQEDEEREP